MYCFNVNDKISVVQYEAMDSEEEAEPHNLFDIVNMEWEKYFPGVTGAPKEKPPLEQAVRKIMTLKCWKESKQEIVWMEVDTVAIRKAKI